MLTGGGISIEPSLAGTACDHASDWNTGAMAATNRTQLKTRIDIRLVFKAPRWCRAVQA